MSLIEMICDVAASRDLIQHARAGLRQYGVLKAIRAHDDGILFEWLLECCSYQGISDAAAASYIEVHGTASAKEIEAALEFPPRCDKLHSFWKFQGCGYRKTSRKCSRQPLIDDCPLPRLDLRNGSLNQAAYHLFLFMRDIAGGDFVKWIDQRLEQTSTEGLTGAIALIEPLSHVHGLSSKVLNMTLSSLLLAGDAKRELWKSVGADMIAIDSLVHNFFHRTGILRGLDVKHMYGPSCYSEGNCADIVRLVSTQIDGRAFHVDNPRYFPRLVQHALWSFCSASEFNQCNGNRINDSNRCRLSECAVYDSCSRLKLGRYTPAA